MRACSFLLLALLVVPTGCGALRPPVAVNMQAASHVKAADSDTQDCISLALEDAQAGDVTFAGQELDDVEADVQVNGLQGYLDELAIADARRQLVHLTVSQATDASWVVQAALLATTANTSLGKVALGLKQLGANGAQQDVGAYAASIGDVVDGAWDAFPGLPPGSTTRWPGYTHYNAELAILKLLGTLAHTPADGTLLKTTLATELARESAKTTLQTPLPAFDTAGHLYDTLL